MYAKLLYLGIIIHLTITAPACAQSIRGSYTGAFAELYIADTSNKEQTVLIPLYDQYKEIVFKKDNTFQFHYRLKGWPCAARSSIRNCSGTYQIVNDTILLRSRYQATDFCKATESSIGNTNGKIMITTHYPKKQLSPDTFINGFSLWVNDTTIGEFRIKDTIYIDEIAIEKIVIKSCSPYTMNWLYIPKNKKANFIDLELIREINTEDIFLYNAKMLRDKEGLTALDDEYFNARDNRYVKIK